MNRIIAKSQRGRPSEGYGKLNGYVVAITSVNLASITGCLSPPCLPPFTSFSCSFVKVSVDRGRFLFLVLLGFLDECDRLVDIDSLLFRAY